MLEVVHDEDCGHKTKEVGKETGVEICFGVLLQAVTKEHYL